MSNTVTKLSNISIKYVVCIYTIILTIKRDEWEKINPVTAITNNHRVASQTSNKISKFIPKLFSRPQAINYFIIVMLHVNINNCNVFHLDVELDYFIHFQSTKKQVIFSTLQLTKTTKNKLLSKLKNNFHNFRF